MTKHAIHADLLMDLTWALSTEETRYYLQGVYIDEQSRLVATDGHVLAVICPEYGKFSPDFFAALKGLIVRLPPPKEARSRRGFQKWIVIDDKTGGLHITQTASDRPPETALAAQPTYISPESCFIDGTFPDWMRVLPFSNLGALKATSVISPAVLSTIASFFEGIDGAFLQFFQDKPDDPIVVRTKASDDRFMVAMPGRGPRAATNQNPYPDWLGRTPQDRAPLACAAE